MKKEDLKLGMVVEVEELDGIVSLCMILPNIDGGIGISGEEYWTPINQFNDELINPYGSKINKVYGLCHNKFAYRLSSIDRKLLWERKKPIEMTVGEIEKELGYPIKVVKEHE